MNPGDIGLDQGIRPPMWVIREF
ncbi:MAG: hypothetical protein L0H12_00040 [Nitrosospira sp.]|nr:hypothetical protein [Nitrosospira sp.]